MNANPPDALMENTGPSDKTGVRPPSRAILLLNLDGLVVSANGVAIKSLGLAESNFLGQSITNLFDKPSPVRMKQYFDRALKGSAVKCQARIKGSGEQSGLRVSLRIRLHVMGPDCSLEAAWEILDASEEASLPAAAPHSELAARVAAFETLFQAYLELQEINKQKTSMLAAATHELKTPLAVITGSSELLLGESWARSTRRSGRLSSFPCKTAGAC